MTFPTSYFKLWNKCKQKNKYDFKNKLENKINKLENQDVNFKKLF